MGVASLLDTESGATLLDFNSATYASGINFLRASSASVNVSPGTPAAVGINVFRRDLVPGSATPRGWLVEGARQNLLLNSETLSTQNVTVTAAAHTLSFYGTGTVTLSGASTAGPLVGTGDYPNRVSLTFTPTAGTLTVTVTGSVQFANLGLGAFASSWIPTAGSSATRALDSAIIADLSLLGFNPTEGTILFENELAGVSGNQWWFQLDDGTTSNRIYISNVNALTSAIVQVGGVNQASMQLNAATAANTVYKSAIAWRANSFAACQNGGTVLTDSSGTIPAVSRLVLGNSTGAAPMFGWIRRAIYLPYRLSNSRMQLWTR
jgi:hypothetical protein